MASRRRGILYAAGVTILLIPPTVWVLSSFPASARPVPVDVVQPQVDAKLAAAAVVSKPETDPNTLIRLGRERYHKDVREYRCVLVKQERIEGELTDVQEVEVRFRESPRSIYMLWLKNAGQARRALFIDDPQFKDSQGRKLARVEPAGAVVRLFVADLYMPIDGPEARKASRRTIDECGFGATFDILDRYNAIAGQRGDLDLRYAGVGQVDGRPTHVIVRELPYEGPGGDYPDARMVLHLDQEWMLPVAVYSYADTEEKTLLGSYVFTHVELNPSLGEDAFKF